MKKVLVVCYSFPPVGGAGVQRPVKFVKYLKEFGWEPVVVSVKNPSVPIFDTSLTKDIPIGMRIYKAKTLEPSYERKKGFGARYNKTTIGRLKELIRGVVSNFLLPDLQVLWWPGLIKALVVAIRSERPNCLFVTAPPFSSFVPVVVLARLFGVPAVLDYRDEWSFSRNTWENTSKGWFAVLVDRLLERFVVSRCAAFTAANKSYVDSLVKAYSRAAAGKGYVITNGFDEDDFRRSITFQAPTGDATKISFLYTGTIWAATSFKPVVAALGTLLREHPEFSKLFTLKIIGRVVETETCFFESGPVGANVELCGYLDHEKVIEELVSADVLLLTLSDLPGAEKIITGKAFEYMASGRHIFAIVPEGETKSLLCSNYNNVTIAHPANVQSIVDGFQTIFDNISCLRHKGGGDVSKFFRRNLTKNLAEVLNRVDQAR